MTAGKTISYTLHGTVQLCDHRLHSFIMRAYNWPISCRKKSATCLLNSKLFNIHKDISTSHQLLSGFLDFETHTWFLCRYSKGPFNNYVDKKRGREGQQKVHSCSSRGGEGVSLECSRGPKFEKKSKYFRKYFVQIDLCQKLLFLHQLTHNMTTDCSY